MKFLRQFRIFAGVATLNREKKQGKPVGFGNTFLRRNSNINNPLIHKDIYAFKVTPFWLFCYISF